MSKETAKLDRPSEVVPTKVVKRSCANCFWHESDNYCRLFGKHFENPYALTCPNFSARVEHRFHD